MKDNYYRHINGVPYKMQFAAYFYTVVPYQALFRLQIYKNLAISKLGAIFLSFCKIRDFGSPTMNNENIVHLSEQVIKRIFCVLKMKVYLHRQTSLYNVYI